jgi:hypothetical protein
MDIAGAKSLKRRLNASSADKAPPSADVPEDALPVYQWLGISAPSSQTSREAEVEEPEAPST